MRKTDLLIGRNISGKFKFFPNRWLWKRLQILSTIYVARHKIFLRRDSKCRDQWQANSIKITDLFATGLCWFAKLPARRKRLLDDCADGSEHGTDEKPDILGAPELHQHVVLVLYKWSGILTNSSLFCLLFQNRRFRWTFLVTQDTFLLSLQLRRGLFVVH